MPSDAECRRHVPMCHKCQLLFFSISAEGPTLQLPLPHRDGPQQVLQRASDRLAKSDGHCQAHGLGQTSYLCLAGEVRDQHLVAWLELLQSDEPDPGCLWKHRPTRSLRSGQKLASGQRVAFGWQEWFLSLAPARLPVMAILAMCSRVALWRSGGTPRERRAQQASQLSERGLDRSVSAQRLHAIGPQPRQRKAEKPPWSGDASIGQSGTLRRAPPPSSEALGDGEIERFDLSRVAPRRTPARAPAYWPSAGGCQVA